MKKTIATDYLLKVLKWESWVEHHKLLAEAIKEVLLELYYLREKVNRYEEQMLKK
jgi:hypothetical protein